ncbi:cyclic nucleotide-binding domain-containing protein [bacterium]|nr:cyclic nucleotide-binding domain-containing protein [bacterium]
MTPEDSTIDATTIRLFDKADDLESYSAGTTIFKAGDPRKFMYVVVEGEVDLYVNNVLVETVEPGGIFGEMALIELDVRAASAVARTDCKVAMIDENRFSFMIERTPYFALKVMRCLVKRVRRMNARLQ